MKKNSKNIKIEFFFIIFNNHIAYSILVNKMDISEQEENILEFWKSIKAFQQQLEKTKHFPIN